MINLIERLTERDVRKLQNAINFPAGLSDECPTPQKFLLKIDRWPGFDSKKFLDALSDVRSDLVYLAKEIPFLTRNTTQIKLGEDRMMMYNFVTDIEQELTIEMWRVMLKLLGYNANDNITYSDIFEFFLDNHYISQDLNIFKECLKSILRNDLADKMMKYGSCFSKMTPQDFE